MRGHDIMFRGPRLSRQAAAILVLCHAALAVSAHDPLIFAAAMALCLCSYAFALPRLFSEVVPPTRAAPGTLSFAMLEAKVRGARDSSVRGNAFYMGRGFVWEARHARQLYDLLASGLTPGTGPRGGSIHALGKPGFADLFGDTAGLNGHCIVFGTTGTGKTTMLALQICQAILRGETVIILDPKGDSSLYAQVRACAERCGRGDDLVRLDVLDSSSDRFNPLSSFVDSSEIGSRIGQLLPQGQNAQSFKAYCEMAITGCVSMLVLQQRPVTLYNINSVIQEHALFYECVLKYLRDCEQRLGDENVSLYFRRLTGVKDQEGAAKARTKNTLPSLLNLRKFYAWLAEKGHIRRDPDLDCVLAVASMDRGFYQKVTASALPVLGSLCSRNLTDIISGRHTPNSFESVILKNRVFYAALHCLQNASVGSRLGKVMLSDLASCAGRLYARGAKSPQRVCVFVDEASELVNESLIQLLNKSRGANFSITLATQTYSDLVSRTGSSDSALQILGNCNTLYALRCIDDATASLVEGYLVRTQGAVRSSAMTFAGGRPASRPGVSRSISLKDRPLFPADAIKLLPNLEFICKRPDGSLVKGMLPFLEGGGA